MKRILVIDESEVVRETLALLLGREFVVQKRSPGTGSLSFADADESVDLLIFGVTPGFGAQASHLMRFAARAPFAVLFLVDSRSTAKAFEDSEQVSCLAKPFNPYQLREKVGRLLARRPVLPDALLSLPEEKTHQIVQYLEYPYLTRIAASLVHRFAATHLPVLISGEIGCGLERVARGIHVLRGSATSWFSVNAREISADYLAQKSLELAWSRSRGETVATLLVEDLDQLPPPGQSSLLSFLEREERIGQRRFLATARADVLEKVYRNDFLDALYYKLAKLTLKLPPLRDRREDIPALASWFAQPHAKDLGLGEVSFSAGANERLSNYLWFGNLSEMETVVVRTLAVRRKAYIEASDLVFDFSGDGPDLVLPELEELVPLARQRNEPKVLKDQSKPRDGMSDVPISTNGHAQSVDLHVLIHELAHELKNPMVTIKTFAQLLGDRYQDEDFRARFQDVVGGDIERMDELLEVLIEFADFSQPRSTKVPLEQKLRSTLEDVSGECVKRQTEIRLKGNGMNREVRADEAQLKYVLKNVLLAVLSQAKMGSEIEIDLDSQGRVTISYFRDGARITSMTHYFSLSPSGAEQSILPLRILLAKYLLERNGGEMAIDHSDAERDILRLELPIA